MVCTVSGVCLVGQKALRVPMQDIDGLWREYDKFEKDSNQVPNEASF
jgi:hypothetical protein